MNLGQIASDFTWFDGHTLHVDVKSATGIIVQVSF